jgi:hypothetical protein
MEWIVALDKCFRERIAEMLSCDEDANHRLWQTILQV